jgi:AAA+ superfamily predicted ATPase
MTTDQRHSPANLLATHLGWLQRLLAWQINVTRHAYGALADDEYRGLYIPDAEADLLCAELAALPDQLAAERQRLADERAALHVALAAQAASSTLRSPLARVQQLFALAPFECDVLLLALAPEIDTRFERLYAYIQDDVTRKRPAIDLALRLLCPTPADRLAARVCFAAGAPLLRHGLISLFEDGQRHATLLGRFIRLDERIAAELIGSPILDPQLVPYTSIATPRRSLDSLVLAPELAPRLRKIIHDGAHGLTIALHGSYGSGRRAVAEALCAANNRSLLTVDFDQAITPEHAPAPAELVRRVLREATLRDAAVLWAGAERVLHEDTLQQWRSALLAALDDHAGWNFLALERPWEARGLLRSFLRIELRAPSFSEREQLWRKRLNGDSPGDSALQTIASTFRLSGGQIRDAAAMARSLAHWRAGDARPTQIEAADLFLACRAQSSGKLESLAHKIGTTYRWDDIVLPAEQVAMLREICIQVRQRRTVLETWGFDRHLAMGKGVNVLFAGQSGTGKTMAAEIIAAELGMELFKVDLSTLVSKYIGETEKNLDRIFTAAREANAILFFDEADSIFGKRSEVKDAHDRYANIEVGYLLQKMEEYDGVVILATNLRKNLDDAFVRRLHVAIDFPFPEELDRARIWQKVFPASAPLAPDVDLALLARQFKLAGGNIRNIALLAAYLAAEEGQTIAMTHVVRAVRREYQKLGKLVTKGEFGPYLEQAVQT